MWRSTFVPETDRTCWTIQTHWDQLYRARRRTFHELNSLSFLRLMKSSTFGLVLMSHITCDVEVENWKCWKVGCVADGVVWWSARGSYQENRAETNFESVEEILHILGRFPFVRTDRPGHSLRNENFTFNQSYPARSVKSQIVCTKEIVFHQKLMEKAYFIFKMTGAAMVQPASSDFWKAPLHMLNSYCAHTASIILNHWKLEFFLNYLQVSPSIDTTHLYFKISILLRPQSDPVWESRCFFFIFFTKSCCRNLSVFGAVLVVFFVVVVSVVCWSSRLTMIMTDKALAMKSSPGLCDILVVIID